MPVLKKILSAFRKLFGGQKASPKRKLKNKQPGPRRIKGKKRSERVRAPSRKRKVRQKKAVSAKPQGVPTPSQKAREDAGEPVGEVTHFFPRIQVVVVKIKRGTLAVADKIRVRGAATDFTQSVGSMQIESVDVRSARRGQLIGLKVVRPARAGDRIYKMPG